MKHFPLPGREILRCWGAIRWTWSFFLDVLLSLLATRWTRATSVICSPCCRLYKHGSLKYCWWTRKKVTEKNGERDKVMQCEWGCSLGYDDKARRRLEELHVLLQLVFGLAWPFDSNSRPRLAVILCQISLQTPRLLPPYPLALSLPSLPWKTSRHVMFWLI